LPKFVFEQEYVVQEYLCDPLLIQNKKFDLRVYVLVIDVGINEQGCSPEPMVAFISSEALVRFCTEDYEKPSNKNMHKLLSHLTNFTLNKLNDKFINSETLENQESSSKQTLSSVFN
jgi:hypothetical protein